MTKFSSLAMAALAAAASLASAAQAASQNLDQYIQQVLASHAASDQPQTLAMKSLASAHPRRDLTPLLALASRHWDDLTLESRNLLAPWLARPTDTSVSYEASWRYDSNLPVQHYDTAHFRVQYVESSVNRSTLAFATVVGTVLEEVYAKEHGELGYKAVPADGGKGGNDLFDVYLTELLSHSLYGYVVAEGRYSDPALPYAAYSYMVLDNDFIGYGYDDATLPLKVTAAHEYFHAVQNGYSSQEAASFMEQTATWMEDIVYPTIHDNYFYIGEPYVDTNGNGQYDNGEPIAADRDGDGVRDDGSQEWPELSLDAMDDVLLIQYGRFLWPRYLGERFGNDIIKSVWQYAATSSWSTLTSVDTALQDRASNLQVAYQEYATWQYDTGKYSDGSNYPLIWVDRTVDGVNLSISSGDSPSEANLASADSRYAPQLHLSSLYTQIRNPTGLYKFTVGNGSGALTMLVDTGGGLSHEAVELNNGVGYWQAPAGALQVVAVISNVHASKDDMRWTLESTDHVATTARQRKADPLPGLGLFLNPAQAPAALLLLSLLLLYRRRRAVARR